MKPTASLELGRPVAAGISVENVPADLDTPVGAFMKLRSSRARFLLESAETGGNWGRYSFIGFGDTEVKESPGGLVSVQSRDEIEENPERDPLIVIKGILGDQNCPDTENVPLLGGAVVAVAFDYARNIEKLPGNHATTWPSLQLLRVDGLVVFDHLAHRACVMTLDRGGDSGRARARNEMIRSALDAPVPDYRPIPASRPEFRHVTGKSVFMDKVRKAKEYIRKGEIFQVVLARREETVAPEDPFLIYRALRMRNPSPYMFYIDFGSKKLIGSSPEMVVKKTGNMARVSPIAGTRPRGNTPARDEDLAADLWSDEKERAEHVMLVDLARNDLGRCCEFGSVEVTQLMRVEKFSHVQHIVSDVEGRVRPGSDGLDLLRACFPAGTVTGAPKIRAMEIIDELEDCSRGPYGGCVGYFSPGGDLDTCLAIRTVFIDGDKAVLQAGAGIVADSVPSMEFRETAHKLAALEDAVTAAWKGRL